MLFTIGAGIGVYIYQKAKPEAERDNYYTKYHFDDRQMDILSGCYRMDIEPPYLSEIMEKDGPDFSYMEILPTERTEIAVELINFWLFDEFLEFYSDAREYAMECGLSYTNRLTEEWVMEHLREAVEIVDRSNDLQQMLDWGGKYDYEQLTSDAVYTPYQMTYRELRHVNSMFGLYVESSEIGQQFAEGRRDFTDMTLQKTDYTEKAAAVMNWSVFEECEAEYTPAKGKAAEYGLSKENPITADWIVTHPKEAIEIKNLMKNYGEILYCEDEMQKIYEKVNRKEIKDVVQWFGELCKEDKGPFFVYVRLQNKKVPTINRPI